MTNVPDPTVLDAYPITVVDEVRGLRFLWRCPGMTRELAIRSYAEADYPNKDFVNEAVIEVAIHVTPDAVFLRYYSDYPADVAVPAIREAFERLKAEFPEDDWTVTWKAIP